MKVIDLKEILDDLPDEYEIRFESEDKTFLATGISTQFGKIITLRIMTYVPKPTKFFSLDARTR